MIEYNKKIAKAIMIIREAHLDATQGLSQDLFWLISALTPIVNVDLLISNDKGQILLARREDEFHPKSWHIPGGCIRFNETMIERVHKTAIAELGVDVEVKQEPIAIRDALRPPFTNRKYQNERRHFISILYRCWLKGEVNNSYLTEEESGYLKWFDKIPPDLIAIQHIYDDILTQWQ